MTSYSLLKNAFSRRIIETFDSPPPVTFKPTGTSATQDFLPLPLPQVQGAPEPANIALAPEAVQVPNAPLASPQVVPTTLPMQVAVPQQSSHDICINHVLECIRCRDELLGRMSFYDRNREIVDFLPYVLLVILLFFIFKKA